MKVMFMASCPYYQLVHFKKHSSTEVCETKKVILSAKRPKHYWDIQNMLCMHKLNGHRYRKDMSQSSKYQLASFKIITKKQNMQKFGLIGQHHRTHLHLWLVWGKSENSKHSRLMCGCDKNLMLEKESFGILNKFVACLANILGTL